MNMDNTKYEDKHSNTRLEFDTFQT